MLDIDIDGVIMCVNGIILRDWMTEREMSVFLSSRFFLSIYIYIYKTKEKKREKERKREREKERKRKREIEKKIKREK